MAMTDPLGDMLTRIRNAQMRKKTKVSTPASKLRQRVLDVLASERVHPRLHHRRIRRRQVRTRGRAEILRWRAGDP